MNAGVIRAQQEMYASVGWDVSNVQYEKEGQEYDACSFRVNDKFVHFRSAKITPIKIGQFVTMWKRINNGPTMPFDVSETFDFFVISVRDGNNFGQFVFPKEALHKHGFISKDGKGGKRAMRVYPSWDKASNAQAKKTQAWQLLYFLDMTSNIDASMIKKLFD